jgi:hypothetical protein
VDAAEGGDLGREVFSELERDGGATEGKAIKRLHEESAWWMGGEEGKSEKRERKSEKSERKR